MAQSSKPSMPTGISAPSMDNGVYQAFTSALEDFQSPNDNTPNPSTPKPSTPKPVEASKEAQEMYEFAMKSIIEKSGGTREQWEEIMRKSAFHEAGPTMSPTIKQVAKGGKEGPGRGLYQYEVDKSADGIVGSNAGKTAVIRALNIYAEKGIEPPAFLKQSLKDGVVEFDKLSPTAQSALFLLDKLGSKGVSKNMLLGDKSLAQFMADWHYIGPKEQRPDYVQKFLASAAAYEAEKKAPKKK